MGSIVYERTDVDWSVVIKIHGTLQWGYGGVYESHRWNFYDYLTLTYVSSEQALASL